MLSTAFSLSKAEECEDLAAEKADAGERDEWELMADEWVAAAMLANEPAPLH
jgi:hypothetical protein